MRKETVRNFISNHLRIIMIISLIILGLLSFTGNGISAMVLKPVMNESKSKEIGKYGEAKYNPKKITDKALINFYNKNVKNSGLNWVELINKNNPSKKIVFIDSINIIEYITLKENGENYIINKTRIIEGNKIEDIKPGLIKHKNVLCVNY